MYQGSKCERVDNLRRYKRHSLIFNYAASLSMTQPLVDCFGLGVSEESWTSKAYKYVQRCFRSFLAILIVYHSKNYSQTESFRFNKDNFMNRPKQLTLTENKARCRSHPMNQRLPFPY